MCGKKDWLFLQIKEIILIEPNQERYPLHTDGLLYMMTEFHIPYR